LEILVEKIEKINNFKRDPNELIMIERNDFTNYLVFFDDFQNNEFLFDKLYEFNPFLKDLKFEQNDERKKYLLRYLYFIIYEVYNGNFMNEISVKLQEKEEEQKFSGNIFEDPSTISKNNKEEIKNEDCDEEIIEKEESKTENEIKKENEELKTDWEIDDKLLIFS